MKGPELTEIAAAEPSSSSVVSSAEDVTARFLQPSENKAKVPLSTIFVYKGILARLSGLVNTDDCSLGILAGKDSVVRDVILGPSIEFVLNQTEVMDRWNTYEYEVLGLCILEHVKTPESYQSDLMKLPNPNKRDLLLLASNAGAQPTAWIYQQCAKHDDQEVPFSLSYHYKPDVVEEKMKSSLWFMPTMSVLNFKIRRGYLFQRSAVVLKDVLMYSTVPYIRANLYNFTVLYHENFAVRIQYCTYGNWTMVHFSEGLHILFINALYITH